MVDTMTHNQHNLYKCRYLFLFVHLYIVKHRETLNRNVEHLFLYEKEKKILIRFADVTLFHIQIETTFCCQFKQLPLPILS